jgi:phytoene dehydrogenase-like protein
MKRPFKGIRVSKGPDDAYDAVIIGAGIGGLVCANLLARQNLKVLLVEQHYMVGGYCSTFKRDGYTFDAASHFYPLLGNPTSMTGKLLKKLGITTQWAKMDPVDLFHLPDGSTFEVSADFEIYLDKLKATFPLEAQAIDAFFSDVREAYMHGLLYYFRRRQTDRIKRYQHLTVKQVLDTFFTDERLKLVLTADSPHWGVPPSRTSFVFDSMLRLSYFLGNYYPVGGSQAFADELAQRFEEQGGHVLMHTMVNRILTSNGAACGIEIETGPRRQRHLKSVQANVVVSNGDLLQTVEHMLGPEVVDADYLNHLKQLRSSFPCYLMHIGVKGISTETLEQAQGYYWNDWDADLMGRKDLTFKIFVPTLFEPAMAPPGGHVVIVQKVLDMDYEGVEDWHAHKDEIDAYILKNLDRVIPGFTDHIVVSTSASAHTSHRFTLNNQGAMLGWEISPDQLGENRPDIKGPIDNMYFTGHWVQPGGGITPVIISAMQVADVVAGGSVPSYTPMTRTMESVDSKNS